MSKADWSWLKIDEVRGATVEDAARTLDAGLKVIDGRLGVDVVDTQGTRQVVVTAGGDAEVFGLVRELVERAPAIGGWSFVALRPARGFDFEVHAGPMVFTAKALSFMPLPVLRPPGQLAIRLLVPNPQLEDWAQIGPQIIEAGIGEEAAARIAVLEIGRREDDMTEVYALESLSGYVQRHAKPDA